MSTTAALVESLPDLVTARMARERLSVRAVAARTGVPFNTVSRLRAARTLPSAAHVVRLLRWLDTPAPQAEAPLTFGLLLDTPGIELGSEG